LLCHASDRPTNRPPHKGNPISVQVFDFGARRLAEPVLSVDTPCYNWQQGARAHWLDGDHFIFNDCDLDARRYISRVYSVAERREVQRHEYPVQDSFGTSYFLSLNYHRLHALRPDYGYRNLPPLDDSALARLDNDGIWRVEQSSGISRLLYSLEDVCDISP